MPRCRSFGTIVSAVPRRFSSMRMRGLRAAGLLRFVDGVLAAVARRVAVVLPAIFFVLRLMDAPDVSPAGLRNQLVMVPKTPLADLRPT